MPTLLADPSFKLYVVCCAVLTLEMLLLSAMTAAKRSGRKNYLNPEDASVSFKDAKLVEGAEHPDVARVQRAHRNLSENLHMFFALGLVSVLVSASSLGVRVCLATFTVARVLHAVVYINELQPWRTIMYAIGSFALLGLMVMSVLAVL
jgi:microsomal prostaglandin-E synthase 1